MRFDSDYIKDIPIIEYVADRLMECVLGLGPVDIRDSHFV
jgi:hypothetical protein